MMKAKNSEKTSLQLDYSHDLSCYKVSFLPTFYDGNQRVPGVNMRNIEFYIHFIFRSFDFVISF